MASAPNDNVLNSSSVFLSIVCGLLIILTIIFNFTFIVILFKMRRLNMDTSNYFVTLMALVDFCASFFILIPSGYGVYNDYYVGKAGCRAQNWFTTFFFGMTFQMLFVISIERYLKYHKPIWHINFFTKRMEYNPDTGEPQSSDQSNKSLRVLAILLAILLLNIFIAFIPLFNNFEHVQYFYTESQCDYIYENMKWWLWIYFILFVSLPFFGSMVFFCLALQKAVMIKRWTNRANNQFMIDHVQDKKLALKMNLANLVDVKKDITRQPCNALYYAHVLDISRIGDEIIDNPCEQTEENDFHVRNELLALYKYDTDKSKLITWIIVTLLSYCLLFPVICIHFYRAYNNGVSGVTYDNPQLISHRTYTAFVWISYLTLVLKSMFCLIQNKFYRHAMYQSANIRGFTEYFQLQKVLFEIEKTTGFDVSEEYDQKRNNKQKKSGFTNPSYPHHQSDA